MSKKSLILTGFIVVAGWLLASEEDQAIDDTALIDEMPASAADEDANYDGNQESSMQASNISDRVKPLEGNVSSVIPETAVGEMYQDISSKIEEPEDQASTAQQGVKNGSEANTSLSTSGTKALTHGEVMTPAEEEKSQPPVQEPVIEGIDNVDLDQPQGNWLFKRIWWEKAEARYEKIKKKIEEIFEQRMIFFTRRSELDKKILDPFYLTIGMGQGEFQAILNELLSNLEKEQERKGFLTSQEREVIELLKSEKKSLEQLSMDLLGIAQVEQEVDAALSQLLKQINAIRNYDREAWDAFKEIARVVDDQEARQLYYKVETAAYNIKEIGGYLGDTFTAHFDQLVTTLKEQTDRVIAIVNALKEKGIDFKKQVEILTAPRQEQPVKKEELPQEPEEEEEEQGFFSSYIVSPLKVAYHGLVSIITWPYYAIFGGGEAADEEEVEE